MYIYNISSSFSLFQLVIIAGLLHFFMRPSPGLEVMHWMTDGQDLIWNATYYAFMGVPWWGDDHRGMSFYPSHGNGSTFLGTK